MQATDASGRVSAAVEGPFRLQPDHARAASSTPTRCRSGGRSAARSARPSPGQLVAVVGAEGHRARRPACAAATSITKIDGKPVAGPGAWATALRALPAEQGRHRSSSSARAPPRRSRCSRRPTGRPPPTTRSRWPWRSSASPRTLAYAIAQARQLIDAAKLADAQRTVSAWPATWRSSGPGAARAGRPARQGHALEAGARRLQPRAQEGRHAWPPPSSAAGWRCRRSTRAGPRPSPSPAAARLDPTDPAAPGFQAYALLQLDRTADALAAAQRAVALDPRYADGVPPVRHRAAGLGRQAGRRQGSAPRPAAAGGARPGRPAHRPAPRPHRPLSRAPRGGAPSDLAGRLVPVVEGRSRSAVAAAAARGRAPARPPRAPPARNRTVRMPAARPAHISH